MESKSGGTGLSFFSSKYLIKNGCAKFFKQQPSYLDKTETVRKDIIIQKTISSSMVFSCIVVTLENVS